MKETQLQKLALFRIHTDITHVENGVIYEFSNPGAGSLGYYILTDTSCELIIRDPNDAINVKLINIIKEELSKIQGEVC